MSDSVLYPKLKWFKLQSQCSASYMSFDTNYKPKGSGFSLETFIESWQSVIKT